MTIKVLYTNNRNEVFKDVDKIIYGEIAVAIYYKVENHYITTIPWSSILSITEWEGPQC
jgi:hypothetical protein